MSRDGKQLSLLTENSGESEAEKSSPIESDGGEGDGSINALGSLATVPGESEIDRRKSNRKGRKKRTEKSAQSGERNGTGGSGQVFRDTPEDEPPVNDAKNTGR